MGAGEAVERGGADLTFGGLAIEGSGHETLRMISEVTTGLFEVSTAAGWSVDDFLEAVAGWLEKQDGSSNVTVAPTSYSCCDVRPEAPVGDSGR